MTVQSYSHSKNQTETTVKVTEMGVKKCSDIKCPKGKYVASNCNATSNTKCETCPEHTFNDQENTMRSCRACRECISSINLELVKNCEADKNTECRCKMGYYCIQPSESYCEHCTPVSKCPPGKGVRVKHTFQSDIVCKPCPEGTYSDVEDYESDCKNHTSCDDFGRYLKDPGTSTSDAKCGDFKCTTSCSWLLPASLWTGLVVTALIVFLVLFIMYWRNKRRSNTAEISLSQISPVLPPDILKYPADFDMEKCVECDKHKAESYTDMDSSIQCDGVMPMKIVPEKCSQLTAANGCKESMYLFTYHSQPQESEWND